MVLITWSCIAQTKPSVSPKRSPKRSQWREATTYDILDRKISKSLLKKSLSYQLGIRGLKASTQECMCQGRSGPLALQPAR
ncbi:unnamed protein product [Parnassius mnemosyne]|uniref:Uncharacterized protein n=1 Tax=Parnassius mnemosyne TaxID=213953 RepID=A0AAV1KEB8_9NEOP